VGDLLAMAVYCTIVHAWGLWITPLGPDAARIAGEAGLTGPAAWALHTAVHVFGSATVPYHLVNAGLIYACMMCVYLIVNRLTAAPTWLGVFAANLWMANPGHREATVALTGMVDLLPCLAALLALTAFLAHDARPGIPRLAALGVFTAAALAFPVNQWIGAVLLLFGAVTRSGRGGVMPRTLLCLAAVAAGWVLHALPSLETASLFDRYGALYFCFYGIGFLPETATRFAAQPGLGWLAVAVVVAVLALAHAKAARPVFVMAIIGMLVHRSSSAVGSVDPVHLVGGGSLVFATALLVIGGGVLYARAMEHKRWAPVLGLASITGSVVFFLLMVSTIAPWREASRLSQAYHAAATTAHAETGEPVVVVPDFQANRGAPLQLSRLLSYSTPFGEAVPHVSALPLDYDAHSDIRYTLRQGTDDTPAHLAVTGPKALTVLRSWEGPPAALQSVDDGFLIPLPESLPFQSDHWIPFGNVDADFDE